LIGIVIGAPSGAIVGAVVPAHTTVYRATPGGATHWSGCWLEPCRRWL